MRTAAFSTALLLGVASLAACSHPAAPTKAEYVQAANATCANAEAPLIKMIVDFEKTKPDDGAKQRWTRRTEIPFSRNLMAQLNGIRTPDGDGAYLRSIYVDLQHVTDLDYADPIGDSSATATAAVNRRLESYGMKVCADLGDSKAFDTKLKAAEKAAKVSPTT